MTPTGTSATIDPVAEPPARTPVGHEGTRVEVTEHRAWAISGFLALLGALVLLALALWQAVGIAVGVAATSNIRSMPYPPPAAPSRYRPL